MEVIKYKTCKSSEEFEEWQRNEGPRIITIIPLYKDFFAEQQNADVSVSVSHNVGVFVTYIDAIKKG